MDVGVDQNAKYVIICRKTVLIPGNDEESSMKLCFIVKENFVRKIAVHRLLFKRPFHVSTTL